MDEWAAGLWTWMEEVLCARKKAINIKILGRMVSGTNRTILGTNGTLPGTNWDLPPGQSGLFLLKSTFFWPPKILIVPRSHPLRPFVFGTFFNKGGNRRFLDYQLREGIISIVLWNLRPIIFGVKQYSRGNGKGGIPHRRDRYNVCLRWCRDTRTVTRVRHHLLYWGTTKSAQHLRDSTVAVRRAQSITVPSSPVTRKCSSPGLRSPPFKKKTDTLETVSGRFLHWGFLSVRNFAQKKWGLRRKEFGRFGLPAFHRILVSTTGLDSFPEASIVFQSSFFQWW